MKYFEPKTSMSEDGITRRVGNIFGDTFHEKFINGMWVPHCEDGPSVIYNSKVDSEAYHLDGIRYTKERFLVLTTKLGRILYG